jgi:NAD(P)-dependent dehydrogenase (short-subunit alcohol dehydrogenase family)
VSADAGVFGLPMSSLYNASKFALEGFSESLSYELGALGIRMKLVEPGGVISTKFGERSAQEASTSSSDVRDYDAFVSAAGQVFAAMRASRSEGKDATSEHVAEVILVMVLPDDSEKRDLSLRTEASGTPAPAHSRRIPMHSLPAW